MPMPNFHTCRIRDPGDFQEGSFAQIERTADGKPLILVIGRLKGETTATLQSFRYPKARWEEGAARRH